MLKNKILFVLVALLPFAACSSDDDNGNGKEIELTDGTQTNQTIYADQTSGANDGIKFTTTGAWQAIVNEVAVQRSTAKPAVDWLTLSQYSGDKAGEYTLTLTLQENYTGSDRKAEIGIVSGSTTIVITIEQKGITKEGEKPVEIIPVESISLNKETLELEIDQRGILSEMLIVTVLPQTASNKGVIWRSSDESILFIDDKGIVTAKKVGTAEITATTIDGGKTATCTVSVVTVIKTGEGSLTYTLVDDQPFIIEKAWQDIWYFSRSEDLGGGGWNNASLRFDRGNETVYLPSLTIDNQAKTLSPTNYIGRIWNNSIPPAGTFAIKVGNSYSFNGISYYANGGTITVLIENNIYTIQIDLETTSEPGGNGAQGKIFGTYKGYLPIYNGLKFYK